jgi:hypothetical protein
VSRLCVCGPFGLAQAANLTNLYQPLPITIEANRGQAQPDVEAIARTETLVLIPIAGHHMGTVDILTELNSHRVPLYALSNWSVEDLPCSSEAVRVFEVVQGSYALWRGETAET